MGIKSGICAQMLIAVAKGRDAVVRLKSSCEVRGVVKARAVRYLQNGEIGGLKHHGGGVHSDLCHVG